MEELNKILNSDKLLDTIPPFQKEIIKVFIAQTNNDYLESADQWLSSSTSQTAKFGTEQKSEKIYIGKLIDEIEKFLCGDVAYDEDRKQISESADKSEKYIIGVMSAALGHTIGVAGTFIAPVIVLVIMSFGKMAVNAWCEMRKEQKEKAETKTK